MHSAPVAGLDQELDVGIHEGDGHGHRTAVWENEARVLAEALDHAENVVPAATIEACGVVAQLVDNLKIGELLSSFSEPVFH